MWLVVKLLIVVISMIYLLRELARIRDLSLAFAFLAILCRFVSSAFYEYTYPPVAAGLSYNALLSIGFAGLGVLVVPKKYFLMRVIVPFYLFWAIILISGVMNGQWIDLINVFTKWLFFLVVCIAIYDSLSRLNQYYVFSRLAKIYLLPLGLQLASLLSGYGKATEADGSISFIGGYNHEAAFSMMLIGFIYLVSFIPRRQLPHQWVYIFIGFIGLVLANYRTSMLAAIPSIVFYLYLVSTDRLSKNDRILGVCAFFAVSLMIGLLVGDSVAERFSDIFVAVQQAPQLWVEPRYYSAADQQLFSARAFIWSQYLTGFSNFDLIHSVFGKGPEAWSGVFSKYAHNTFISYLYEYGWLGFGLFLLMCASLFWVLMDRSRSSTKTGLVAALTGFTLLNLATMPLWNIEGLIAFAILVAAIFNYRRDSRLASEGGVF